MCLHWFLNLGNKLTETRNKVFLLNQYFQANGMTRKNSKYFLNYAIHITYTSHTHTHTISRKYQVNTCEGNKKYPQSSPLSALCWIGETPMPGEQYAGQYAPRQPLWGLEAPFGAWGKVWNLGFTNILTVIATQMWIRTSEANRAPGTHTQNYGRIQSEALQALN